MLRGTIFNFAILTFGILFGVFIVLKNKIPATEPENSAENVVLESNIWSMGRSIFKKSEMIQNQLQDILDNIQNNNKTLNRLLEKDRSNFIVDNEKSTLNMLDKIQSQIFTLNGYVNHLLQEHALNKQDGKLFCTLESESVYTWTETDDSFTLDSADCKIDPYFTDVSDVIGKFQHVAIIGDSISRRLMNTLMSRLSEKAYEPKRFGRRSIYKYILGDNSTHKFKLRSTSETIEEGIGPLQYGKERPGYTDCSGCDSQKFQSKIDGSTIEYITMEFLKDVVLKTDKYPTTQDAIFDYLLQGDSKPDLILFMLGSHDRLYVSINYQNATKYPEPRYHYWRENLDFFSNKIREYFPDIPIVALEPPDTLYQDGEVILKGMSNITKEYFKNNNKRLKFHTFDTSILTRQIFLHPKSHKSKTIIPDAQHPIPPFFHVLISLIKYTLKDELF